MIAMPSYFVFEWISKFDCLSLQAAAAMCVGIGSFSDPPEAQGLAHFLGLCYTYS